jgi:Amt family ammonium transporter
MSEINTVILLLGTANLFFMQVGFALLESGFSRTKNSENIIIKNLLGICITVLVFLFVGFGFMFGPSSKFFGWFDFFINGNYLFILPEGVSKWSFVIFHISLCALVVTIASSAMAERIKLTSYSLFCLAISLIVYPVSGHWIWGNGWLSNLGFHDFSGSTVVSLVGGMTAFIGAKVIGPRIGKYSSKGKSNAIPGNNIMHGAIGIFIIWFCWLIFNLSAAIGIKNYNIEMSGIIFINTIISFSVSSIITMLFTVIKYKKLDVSMVINGALSGLVSISAGCDVVSPLGAAFIGICSALVSVYAIEYIDKALKIDDPIGSIGAIGVSGALGTILVGLLSTDRGLFYNGSLTTFTVQIMGVLSVIVWTGAIMFLALKFIDKTIGLRVSTNEELEGLEGTDYAVENEYADSLPLVAVNNGYNKKSSDSLNTKKNVPVDEAIPIKMNKVKSNVLENPSLTKIEIITKQSKFEELKIAMNKIGITGMTFSNVLGCGIQKGATEYYRGVPLEMMLIPKVKVEIVVAKVPVEEVVFTARKVLYTGHIGDGKIFIYDVTDVVKVRTGETGYDAMQGIDA